MPLAAVLREHALTLLLGTFAAVAMFVVFYLMTVFTLSWGTSKLGYTRQEFLILQMIGVLFFGLTIPAVGDGWRIASVRAAMLIVASVGHGCLWPGVRAAAAAGQPGSVLLCLALGLGLMGVAYGPLGAALASLFPTAVRYTGASLTFNLAGIIGASLTPYAATWLATRYGLAAVGYYLSIAAPADAGRTAAAAPGRHRRVSEMSMSADTLRWPAAIPRGIPPARRAHPGGRSGAARLESACQCRRPLQCRHLGMRAWAAGAWCSPKASSATCWPA